MIRAWGSIFMISRMAVIPSISGMVMSMVTKSGFRLW